MRIISVLHSHRLWAEKLAMSSRYRSAVVIIARCIGAVMKPRGGTRPVSIRARRRASFGLKHIRCQAQLVKPGQNCETKPIWKLAHMTSFRQIEANRRNALKSTGPKTELGSSPRDATPRAMALQLRQS